MSKQGKDLERFVSRIEKHLLPAGFEVSVRERAFRDDGRQIAEFDLVVRGMIGSAPFKWLIECRDRPSDGTAPGAWIEQLVGRRSRHNFDKVTAVSTTGFAPGAREFAESEGVDLRTVESLDRDSVASWFPSCTVFIRDHYANLLESQVIVDGVTPDRLPEIRAQLQQHRLDDLILATPDLKHRTSVFAAWKLFIHANPDLFDRARVGRLPREVALTAQYRNPADRFHLVTDFGALPVTHIHFHAVMSLNVKELQIEEILQYSDVAVEEPIGHEVRASFRGRKGISAFSLLRIQATGKLAVEIKNNA